MENTNINPWLRLWTSPRKTFRAILNTHPNKSVLLLAIVGGIISSLTVVAHKWVPSKSNSFYIWVIIAAMIAGALLGILNLYFSGWLLSLTGAWLGGKGDFLSVKSGVGWSNYPFIFSNICSILIAVFTNQIWPKAFFTLLNLIIVIWGLFIYFKLIAEAHQFSAWKALLAVLIAVVLIMVALMIIVLIIPLLSPLFE